MRTSIPIKELLNPQQPNTYSQSARQNPGLSRRQMQVEETDEKKSEISPRHCELALDRKSSHPIRDLSSTINSKRRAPRRRYTEEEMYFIWYHRVDLNEDWTACVEAFNRQFYRKGLSERNMLGIQTKFYRFIQVKGCPTVRKQQQHEDRSSDRHIPKFGVIEWCKIRYQWMNKHHREQRADDVD